MSNKLIGRIVEDGAGEKYQVIGVQRNEKWMLACVDSFGSFAELDPDLVTVLLTNQERARLTPK